MHGLEDALASNEPAFLNQLDHPRIVPVREAQWDPEGDRAISFVNPDGLSGARSWEGAGRRRVLHEIFMPRRRICTPA